MARIARHNRHLTRPQPSRWFRAGSAGVNLLLPAHCPRCGMTRRGQAEVALCTACSAALSSPVERICSRCASFVNPYTMHDGRCAHCRHVRYRFDQAIALGPYEGQLRQAIVRMKQSAEQSLTYSMGLLLGERAITLSADDLPDYVAPVPMHWVRRVVRIASSPEIMAEAIAGRLATTGAKRLITCLRKTQKQSLLSPEERRRNVAKAFCVNPRFDVRGRHVGLVDDIITTGATANAVARVLKSAGARRVTALVAARASRPDIVIRKPK